MGLFERLTELGQSALTIDTQIKQLQKEVDGLSQDMREIGSAVGDLRERIVRLETGREADRAHLETQIARFQLEVERAQLQAQRALPPSR